LRRPYVRKHFALHACDHLPTDLSSPWTSNRDDILYGRECPESSNSVYRPHLTLSRESNEVCRGYIPGGSGVGVGSLANINLNLAIFSMFAKTEAVLQAGIGAFRTNPAAGKASPEMQAISRHFEVGGCGGGYEQQCGCHNIKMGHVKCLGGSCGNGKDARLSLRVGRTVCHHMARNHTFFYQSFLEIKRAKPGLPYTLSESLRVVLRTLHVISS